MRALKAVELKFMGRGLYALRYLIPAPGLR